MTDASQAHEPTEGRAPSFQIFKTSEAPAYDEMTMDISGLTPVIEQAFARAAENGDSEGQDVRLLFKLPGMSLTYAWFKSGFPLPLHTHNADCVYYIVAGSLKLGTEELGPGDGFFVGKNVPYTYVPGPKGVEILEFRTAERFDIEFKGKTEAYWDKIISKMIERRPHWQGEAKPSEI